MGNHIAVFGVKPIDNTTWASLPPWKYGSRARHTACLLAIVVAIIIGGMFSAPVFSASPAPSGNFISFDSGANPPSKLLSRGGKIGLFSGEDILPPDEAFPPPHVEVRDADTLFIQWQITKGYYLYRDRFRFEIQGAPGVQLGSPRIPRGVSKEEEDSGPVEVFFDEVGIALPIIRRTPTQIPLRDPRQSSDASLPHTDAPTRTENSKTIALQLTVGYQGCAEAGLCYPPSTKTLHLDLPNSGDRDEQGNSITTRPTTIQPTTGIAATGKEVMGTTLPESDRLAYAILGNSLWMVLPIFFGFGLLLGFTPCVFPMVPIIASIIAGQGKAITTRKALALSMTYVLAMAVTYTVAGVIAGLSGRNLQAAFQNPWVITTFSAIFVLLALSTFGLFRIQIPITWQTKLTMRSNLQKGGTFAGVGIMGFLSALIVGPCVAPPLAGALIAIGTTSDPIRGGLALFSLSLGMGTPLIAVGTSAGRWLPKTGPWMEITKNIFGVLLLVVAIYLLGRVIPNWVSMFLWAVLLIMIGTYLGALDRLESSDGGWRRFRKGVGIIAMVHGITLMVGASLEYGLVPSKGFVTGGDPEVHAPLFERIKTHQELEAKLAASGVRDSTRNDRGNRLIMLDYYADWCATCKEMERRTFSDPGVRRVLADMVLLQADVTDNDKQDQAMLRAFGLYGPPAILFFGPDGKEYSAYRVQGFMNAEEFREHVRRLRDMIP